LTKDVFYRLVLEPTSATDITSYHFSVNAAAVMDVEEGGQNFHYTEKKDGGWTDTVTDRPMIGLLIDQFDDGAGGAGGMIVHPGMSGGMRG